VDPGPATDGDFDAPSAVAIAGDFLFVANASFRYACGDAVYAPATVTVVALADLSIVARLPTSAPDAQFLTAGPGAVWAVSSGASRFDGAVVWPDGDGAIDRFDVLSGGLPPAAASQTIAVPRGGAAAPLVGFPTRLALSADGARALAGSGTDGVVFRADLGAGAVDEVVTLFPSMGGLNSAAEVRVEAGRTHVLGFNSDQYCLGAGDDGALDTAALACADVGDSPDFIDGPLDLAVDAAGDTAWVVFSVANAVYRVDLSGGAPVFTGEKIPAGVAPNRIVRDAGADRYLVVSSASNALFVFTAGDAEAAVLAAFPPGTNPYDVAVDRGAFAPPGGRAFVPGLLTDDVSVVDLATGAIVAVLQ
jgi:DNA-binding beta-propeller fold protein YncE